MKPAELVERTAEAPTVPVLSRIGRSRSRVVGQLPARGNGYHGPGGFAGPDARRGHRLVKDANLRAVAAQASPSG